MGGELSLFGLDGGDDCEVLETLLGVTEEDGRFIFDRPGIFSRWECLDGEAHASFPNINAFSAENLTPDFY